jgi:phosphoribosylanthranilate isomerase
MFRVKICGITTVVDAQTVAAAGADAVGLNFFEKSARFLPAETARAVADAVPEGVVKVGLFVNAIPEQILETWDRLSLDVIQLHGDEPPEVLLELQRRPVMRAFRLGNDGLAPVLKYLERCRELGCLPSLVLIDSFHKGHYGGTGKTADWEIASRYPSEAWHPPIVLAGGLTPENVAQAIAAVRPSAVDTASGVEVTPGRKDAGLVQQFVAAARRAFGSM